MLSCCTFVSLNISRLSSQLLFSLSVITKFRCNSMMAERYFRLPDSGIIMAFSSRGPRPNVNGTVTFNYTRVRCRSRDRGRGTVKGKGGRRGGNASRFRN